MNAVAWLEFKCLCGYEFRKDEITIDTSIKICLQCGELLYLTEEQIKIMEKLQK